MISTAKSKQVKQYSAVTMESILDLYHGNDISVKLQNMAVMEHWPVLHKHKEALGLGLPPAVQNAAITGRQRKM